MHMEEEFANFHIDDVYNEGDQVIEAVEVEVLQLKENNSPRGLVPLEVLFDLDDVAKIQQFSPHKEVLKM